MRLKAFALALMCLFLGATAQAASVSLRSGQMLMSSEAAPPAPGAPWQQVELPDEWRQERGVIDGTTLWYRFEFAWPDVNDHEQPIALYVPYLSNGGAWFLNGHPLAPPPAIGDGYIVRGIRPQLIYLPHDILRTGGNVLLFRTVVREFGEAQQMPQLIIGNEAQLRPAYERRVFLVHTIPHISVIATGIISAIFLLIWWRRRQEQMYGLLGLAALLWGVRTLTIVSEVLPAGLWPLWRVIYHAATGGFVVSLTLFVLQLAGSTRRWVTQALLAYWAVGPSILLISVTLEHPLISAYWTLGMMMIGWSTLALSFKMAFQQRSLQNISMCTALSLTGIAGFHDFLADADVSFYLPLAPAWAAEQVFWLPNAANLMLIVMTGILIMRFLQSIEAVDELNSTLKQRIMERENQLQKSYEELSRLNRERAADEERQRLARDMHDGLGSQLFTSWHKLQREPVSHDEMKEILQESITEMRLALDALAASDDDFQSALGNLRYRWEGELRKAGIESSWHIDELKLPAHQRLHVLRILQEALTNVLKHANASQVVVRAVHDGGCCRFEVSNNGCEKEPQKLHQGIGMKSMRERAAKIGGMLDFERNTAGAKIQLVVPLTLQ